MKCGVCEVTGVQLVLCAPLVLSMYGEVLCIVTCHYPCGCVQELNALVDRKSGKKVARNPRFVKQDQVVIATLQTNGVICVENFKKFPQMARFTLRDEGMMFV